MPNNFIISDFENKWVINVNNLTKSDLTEIVRIPHGLLRAITVRFPKMMNFYIVHQKAYSHQNCVNCAKDKCSYYSRMMFTLFFINCLVLFFSSLHFMMTSSSPVSHCHKKDISKTDHPACYSSICWVLHPSQTGLWWKIKVVVSTFTVGWEGWINRALDEPYKAYKHTLSTRSLYTWLHLIK